MERNEQAIKYFMEGYNCAQAVVMAFSDLIGMDAKTCAKLSSSFGGGMGRMREVCGAVSGMLMVAGMLYGYDGPEEGEVKKAHYQRVQELAGKFREKAGSIVCRDILKNPPSDPSPAPRTAAYYQERPCAKMVDWATQIMEQYIAENTI